MEHPKAIGDRATPALMLALREAGYDVSVPFGENVRYDLIIDDGQRLARVQCKSGRLREGAVVFSTASTYLHHPHPGVSRRAYHGEIDYFGVYCVATGAAYLVPIEDIPTRTQAMLRVSPSRNGRRKRVRHAAAYEVGTVALTPPSTPALRGSSGARGSCA